MCKAHFKAMKRATTPLPKVIPGKAPPPPEGNSVYDYVLPASIGFTNRKGSVMPLIAHLKAGFDELKPPAWHRNEERRARGIYPVENPATQLEGWERELVWMEILVLTGAPGASFRHLARAWGRDKGFHMVLAQFICERQGDVQRKKRIDKEAEGKKSRGPAKKRRRLKKSNKNDPDVSADIWDDSAYGDVITNEALAADIFDFSPQEFESATALHRWKHMEEANSDNASLTSQRSAHQTAATQAILGEGGKILPKPVQKAVDPRLVHPEDYPETSTLAPAPGGNAQEQHHYLESQRGTDPNRQFNNTAGTHAHGHYPQGGAQQQQPQHYQGEQSQPTPCQYADPNAQVHHGQQYHNTAAPQQQFQQPPQQQAGTHEQDYGQLQQNHNNMIHHQPAPSGVAMHHAPAPAGHDHSQYSQAPDPSHFAQPVQDGGMAASHDQQQYYQGNAPLQQAEAYNNGPTGQSQYADAPERYDQQMQGHEGSNLHHQQQPFDHGHHNHQYQQPNFSEQSHQHAQQEHYHHQQREHPEQNPETSALPPELGHPNGQYQDQSHHAEDGNQGY